jgi:hypothetical protein
MSLSAEQRRALEILATRCRERPRSRRRSTRLHQSAASRRWVHRRHVGRPGPRGARHGATRDLEGGRPKHQGRALSHHGRRPEGARRLNRARPRNASQAARVGFPRGVANKPHAGPAFARRATTQGPGRKCSLASRRASSPMGHWARKPRCHRSRSGWAESPDEPMTVS